MDLKGKWLPGLTESGGNGEFGMGEIMMSLSAVSLSAVKNVLISRSAVVICLAFC